MFEGTPFNQDISGWNTSSATTIANMFDSNHAFNQPLNNWDVSQVTDMNGVFADATSFNQDLSNWDTSQVTKMSYLFSGAIDFNQDISMWNFTRVIDPAVTIGDELQGMFDGVTLSTANYDLLLNALAMPLDPLNNNYDPVVDGMLFSGGNSKYSSAGLDARNYLSQDNSWTISDGGLYDAPVVPSSSGQSNSWASNNLKLASQNAITGDVVDSSQADTGAMSRLFTRFWNWLSGLFK